MLTHEQYGMCCAERKKCTIKENKAEYVNMTDYIRAEQSEKNRNRSGADENLIFIQSRNTIEAERERERKDLIGNHSSVWLCIFFIISFTLLLFIARPT